MRSRYFNYLGNMKEEALDSKSAMDNSIMCSVICPAYNESPNLPKLIGAVSSELSDYAHEIIVIDDGSADDTITVLECLAETYATLRYISFTRNFGHQNALMAGLRSAQGECVIMLDGDMQHPPSLIVDMLSKWKSGYKVVQGLRQEKSSGLKALTSKWFYGLVSFMSDVPIAPGTSDFRLIDRIIVDHINELDRPVFLRGYIPWLGYETSFLPYTPNARFSGKTKYTLGKMLKLSLEGITTQSTFPLRLSRYIGTMVSLLAFLYLLYAIYVHVFTDETVPGWTSILISVLFLGGVQLIFLGVLGEYIGRIFERSYRKPIYQIKKEG